MVYLQACWSPCWCYNNVKHGTIAVAIFTAMSALIGIVYAFWMISGGYSADLYTPFFETDVRSSAKWWGAIAIVICLFFLGAAFLLWRGTMNNIRGYFIPWMVLTILLILYTATYGIYLVARYYIDPTSVLAAIYNWLYCGLNIYFLLCVLSQYHVVKMYQSPHYVVASYS